MLKRIGIGLGVWLCSVALWAISEEQEQQFLYYFYAAHQAIDQQQFDRALVLLDFCEQIHEKDGLTKDYLGAIYDAMGDKDKALAYFEQAYACAPEDCWQRYSAALLKQPDAAAQKQALKILESTTKQLDKNEDAWEMLQQAYRMMGQWKKALRVQDRLDQLTGYDEYSAISRYRIYTAWGKPKEAMAAIDDYIRTDPRNYQFLLFKGDLLKQEGKYIEAFVTYVEIGDSLANIEEVEGAYMAYDKALEMDADNLYVLNNYSYILATHGGDLKQAERMSQVTIQAEPTNATFLDTYAWILYLQGQQSLAYFYIRKALENSPKEWERNVIQEHYQIINAAQ